MQRFANLLLLLCLLMLIACQQTDEQKAEQLARKFMIESIGANAVNRAHVEVRSSEAGWQVIFRDTYANCDEGSFWPGACRSGPRTFRDVYACVDLNWTIHQLGASTATQPIDEQTVCHTLPSGPTIAPAPTDPAREAPTATVTPRLSVTPTPTQTRSPSDLLITPPPSLGASSTQTKSSPDGQWLAVSSVEQTGSDLHILFQVIRGDGSVSWTVIDRRSHGLGYIAPQLRSWSQDSQHFYFTETAVADGCGRAFGNDSGLKRVDVKTGRVTQVLVPSGYEHSISPDESTVAYLSLDQPPYLILHRMQSSTDQQIALPAQSSEADRLEAGNIVWSPDGLALVLTIIHGDLCGSEPPIVSIARVDVPVQALTLLIASDRRLLWSQEWSADGRILLRDWNRYAWWIDALTGKTASAPMTPAP